MRHRPGNAIRRDGRDRGKHHCERMCGGEIARGVDRNENR